MFTSEAFEASLEVIRVFKKLSIDYLVGGSLASSYHGTPRSTNDADLVADLKPVHVTLMTPALREHFYLDPSWSTHLDVRDLLARALQDAGID